MANQDLVRRGGMLQRNEQLAERADHRSDELPLPRPEFVLEFLRSIIKNNPNGDVLALSMMEAAKNTSATKEEIAILKEAVRGEMRSGSMWPKGFFSSL